MSLDVANRLTRAVMYEGYLLYPYTPSATKNRQRWTFGGLYPPRYTESRPGADAAELQCQCLVEGDEAEIQVRIRFLHIVTRRAEDGEREEALEREYTLPAHSVADLAASAVSTHFVFPGAEEESEGVRRTRHEVQARIDLASERLESEGSTGGLYRCTIRVENTSRHAPATRSEAVLHSMAATHLVLSVFEGRFLSLTDPPEPWRRHADECRNLGTWPVLLGEAGDASHMLSAPIILYDYPQIAPESPGDLFDAGEIDEVLSLRIRTLTDAEKLEIRSSDPLGRAMLERTERLTPEDLLRLHGAWRQAGEPAPPLDLQPGCRVRIRPKKFADAFDLILSGMTATVEKIEQDLEGGFHVVVALEDDPGRDLDLKAQLGHRFFYRPEDLERL